MRSPRQRWCSGRCHIETRWHSDPAYRERHLASAKTWKRRHGAKPKIRLESKVCESCGEVYQPRYAKQRFCGRDCKFAGQRSKTARLTLTGGKATYCKSLLRDPCAYCGGPGGERDHIVPRAIAGGTTGKGSEADVENLTGACQDCNRRKSDTPLLHFLLERVS